MKIGNYTLVGELKNDNSGYAKWGFATKDKKTYFIKEFLSPVYPLDDSPISNELKNSRRKICNEFVHQKENLYSELKLCDTGNIIIINDFFRFGSKYYIVTDQVEHDNVDAKYVADNFDDSQKMILFKVLLHNFAILHEHGIVHGDIKPTNILIKKTKYSYTAKIIDFDSSFFEKSPPSYDELQGDMVYFSPEAFLLVSTENYLITNKTDVFSLGLLMHEYYTGTLPYFDNEKYTYPFEAVLDDQLLEVSHEIPYLVRKYMESMLSKHPSKRPKMIDVFTSLNRTPAETYDSADDETVRYTITSINKKPQTVVNGSDFFKVADDDML